MVHLGRARTRARALTLITAASLATALGGCAASGSSNVKVSGKALTIYASVPAGTASDQTVQDVLDAERLAFTQRHSEVTAFTLSLRTIQSAKLSDNGRTAIQDTTAIAYLGEIRPGASAGSLGITNAQDLLQVSPTDTAIELTQSTPAVPNSPNRYYESLKTYGRTFARVVPNGVQEAKAQVQEMQALKVSRLYVADDGTPYGRAIARAVRQDAAPSITVVSTPGAAEGAFYGAGSATAAIRAMTNIAQNNPGAKLFGPSALATDAFAAGMTAGARNVYISVPGVPRADLPPAGQTFIGDFTSTYGHAPAAQAIFGFEAMAAVLDVLKQAGTSANNRSTVVSDFFAIKNRNSALPTYSINANGDTSLGTFVFARVRAGKLVLGQG
jgi:branched-chain amino acid transport system substrate-binding protein